MVGKSFKGGVDSLLGDTTEKVSGGGRPKTNFKVATNTSQVGTKENETRATFIVSEEQLESVKALAYWERVLIKDVLAKALDEYLVSKKAELQKAIVSYKTKVKVKSSQ